MTGYEHPQTPFGSLAQVLIQVFFPMKCPFCGEVVERKERACAHCVEELPRDSNAIQKAYIYLDESLSAFIYTDSIPNCVKKLKYGHPALAELAADLMMDVMGEDLKSREFDMVLAVPMHPVKQKKRGYNQAEVLARALAERLGIEYGENVLAKIKNNGVQHFLSATARRKNVQGVYKVVTPEEVQERRILLVDDVLTTGSTFNECAYILKIAGAKWVCGTTFAHAVREDADEGDRLVKGEPEPVQLQRIWEDAECETATLLYEFYQSEESAILVGEEDIEIFQEDPFDMEVNAETTMEEDLLVEEGWGDDFGDVDYEELFESELENDTI